MEAVFLGLAICAGLTVYIIFFKKNRSEASEAPPSQPVPSGIPEGGNIDTSFDQENYDPKPALGVGEFYNEQTGNFLKVYGEVIQAFRTKDLSNLLNYQIESIGLKPGMKVLDAGCGVCGPACYFAEHAGVSVEAVTISEDQVKRGKEKIKEKGLEDRVHVQLADYHQVHKLFPANTFDAVYFLESFGHSHDKAQLLDAAWQVLKPGGTLYIKDLFIKEASLPGHRQAMDREIRKINEAYHYHLADLHKFLETVRKKGWILAHLKTIDLPLEDFENLTISNDFQELTGIARIDDWASYIFPVDFFEVICHKPWHDPKVGNSRYFLQNLYYLQVHGRGEETL